MTTPPAAPAAPAPPKFAWLDGELVDWSEATIHVTTLALHYGIGFFEGIRCHATAEAPAFFRLGDHLRRLGRSAAIYGVELPYSQQELAEACRQVVRGNGLTDCYVRPLVFLGQGPNPLQAPFRCAVIASAAGPLAGGPKDRGVKAQISAFQRYGANALPPAAKATGQYLNAFLAQRAAVRSGFEEAIFLNEAGFVADGWAHNVFIVTGGELVAPPVWTGGLPGITRDTVLGLAAEHGIPVAQRPLVRSDLYLADECFLTGTATGVTPVVSVDERAMAAGAPGPVTRKVASMVTAVAVGTSETHPEWREYVH